MLRSIKPDTVIVTTKDSMYDFYVIKALKAGCDVIAIYNRIGEIIINAPEDLPW